MQNEYGFYDRLNANFPSQVIVDATEICNLACIHCPHPEFKKSEHYSAKSLTLELNNKMADEVKTHGKGITQYIRYTSNGEPLANPKIYEMLKYSVENSGTTVCLTTNGTLLNPKNLEKVLATGVDLIDISIDAFSDDVYSKIRVNGKLPITRGNVVNLLKTRSQRTKPLKVVVSYVEQPQNQHESKDFEKFWKDQGADFVIIRKLHSASGGVKQTAETLREKGNEQERYPCLYPWERITLNPEGYLSFCPSDWVHGSNVCDYRGTTIKETWQGQFYQELRKAHQCNSFGKHKFCGQCPDWQLTTWPKKTGRSYANMIEDFGLTEQV